MVQYYMDYSFSSFLALDCNRIDFIDAWLTHHSIQHSVIKFGDKRHIVVRFPAAHYDPRFRMKTLVAHHDRALNTPGANDNSAACFQLMLFADELQKSSAFGGQTFTHNIRILFTDGEEAVGKQGIRGQGSFRLGVGLKSIGEENEDMFVFDATGSGDTLVISTAGISSAESGSVGEKLAILHEKALQIAKIVSPENWIRLPTPFSDNAGFLASGIPAQVVTVLPHEEATNLLMELSMGTEEEKKRINQAIVLNSHKKKDERLLSIIPKTWQRMHTPLDTQDFLTTDAFAIIRKFLLELARRKDIVS